MPISPPGGAHAPCRDVPAAYVPLTVATRGGVAESVHYGAVAVVSRAGKLLYAAGDPDAVTFTRSALKPFQAMAFAAAGGIEHFRYGEAQVALLCASHSGERRHVEQVGDMLRRAGNDVSDLQCGAHAPMFHEVQGTLPPPPPYSPLAHNCSGKHAGMLAYCALCDWPKASYLDPDHPGQRAIRAAVAHFLGTPEADLVLGTDGCSAPNYAAPLARLAHAYARLANPEDDPMYGDAPRRLAAAMTTHPEMVSGAGRSDAALMQAGRGEWVTKIGAEGVQGIGVREAGLGIAVKVADGAKRALLPAVVQVLEALGLLDAAQRRALAPWHQPGIANARGTIVGRIEPVVRLAPVQEFEMDQMLSPAGDPR